MADPFGWGGLYLVPPIAAAANDDHAAADEYLIELDAMEAERFRLELERDARGDQANWPDE